MQKTIIHAIQLVDLVWLNEYIKLENVESWDASFSCISLTAKIVTQQFDIRSNVCVQTRYCNRTASESKTFFRKAKSARKKGLFQSAAVLYKPSVRDMYYKLN